MKRKFYPPYAVNFVLAILLLCVISCSDKKQFEQETEKQSFAVDKFEATLLVKYGFSERSFLSRSELTLIDKSLNSTTGSYRQVEHLLNKEKV